MCIKLWFNISLVQLQSSIFHVSFIPQAFINRIFPLRFRLFHFLGGNMAFFYRRPPRPPVEQLHSSPGRYLPTAPLINCPGFFCHFLLPQNQTTGLADARLRRLDAPRHAAKTRRRLKTGAASPSAEPDCWAPEGGRSSRWTRSAERSGRRSPKVFAGSCQRQVEDFRSY